jgi:hypothetical protein
MAPLSSALKILVVLAISPIAVCVWFWGWLGALLYAVLAVAVCVLLSRAGLIPCIEDDLLCLPEDNWG